MTGGVLVLPATRFPCMDTRAWRGVLDAVSVLQPRLVIHTGDILNSSTGARAYRAVDRAVRELVQPLRNSFTGSIVFHEGQTDTALANSLEASLPDLLQYERFGVEDAGEFYQFSPGWESCYSNAPGENQALKLARSRGNSVVLGGTYRAGTRSQTRGADQALSGVEVGHLLDRKSPVFQSEGHPGWNKAMVWFPKAGSPRIIPVGAGRFTIEDKEFTF